MKIVTYLDPETGDRVKGRLIQICGNDAIIVNEDKIRVHKVQADKVLEPQGVTIREDI